MVDLLLFEVFSLVGAVAGRVADLTADAAFDDVSGVGKLVRAGPCSVTLLVAILAEVFVEDALH